MVDTDSQVELLFLKFNENNAAKCFKTLKQWQVKILKHKNFCFDSSCLLCFFIKALQGSSHLM